MDNVQYTKLPPSESEHRVTQSSSERRMSPTIFIYSILLFSNIIFLGLWREAVGAECVRPQLIQSPAKVAIRYEKIRLRRDLDNNPYTGSPRPEFDAAWSSLIEPLAMKITSSELKNLGQTSIPLIDGSGFLAEMAVYHELHCIKRIRRHFHLDYYYPNITAEDQRREEIHIDHCLEYWREAAMCRGDVSLATFQWAEDKPFSRVWSDHECVDWENLDGWARTRMLDVDDLELLAPSERGADK